MRISSFTTNIPNIGSLAYRWFDLPHRKLDQDCLAKSTERIQYKNSYKSDNNDSEERIFKKNLHNY